MNALEAMAEPITVDIPEACRLTGIGRSKLYQSDGEIASVKVGKRRLILFDKLRTWLEALAEQQGH